MESKKYSLNKADALKIAKVLGYSVASALIASLISLLPQIDAPQAVILIPLINTLLVSLKKYLSEKGALL